MAMAVKISQPKGGVAEPIATCKVINTPTSTGSRPEAAIAGAKMGVSTRITTIGSTNMQATKKATEMAANTPTGPASLIPKSASNVCGTWAKEMIQAKPLPTATKMKTTAVIRPVDLAMA